MSKRISPWQIRQAQRLPVRLDPDELLDELQEAREEDERDRYHLEHGPDDDA